MALLARAGSAIVILFIIPSSVLALRRPIVVLVIAMSISTMFPAATFLIFVVFIFVFILSSPL
jgi:hypothetical protein